MHSTSKAEKGPVARRRALQSGVLYAAIGAAASLLPPVLARLHTPFIYTTYGSPFTKFELLGMTGALALAAVAFLELRRSGAEGWQQRLELMVPFLVALHFLTLISEYAIKPFDYDCYEYAGRALLLGENPHMRGLIYLYPPLTAQAMALAFRVVDFLTGQLGWSLDRDAVWDQVFYLYQCAQLYLILLAYFLCRSMARQAGLASFWASLLVAALLFFDNALFRTLRHGQINLWVLDFALIGILFSRRAPLLAGAGIALAAHLKLYPLILLIPLAASGRWRAMLWTVVAFTAIALLQTDLGRDWTVWRWFVDFFLAHFPGERAFRNNSLHSLFFNTLRLFFADRSPEVWRRVLGAGLGLATLAAGVWFLQRLWARERAFRAVASSGRAGDESARDARRFLAHGADALAFALLLSPSVWEHHYVLAIPLALWAVAMRWRDRPGALALGIFLMLAMPTFDVFPLSYHRLAGMLLLLALTSPGAVARADEAGEDELGPPSSADPGVIGGSPGSGGAPCPPETSGPGPDCDRAGIRGP